MAEFKVGDRVRVVSHPNKRYIGLEGDISEAGQTFGSTTQPLSESAALPPLGKEVHYTVRLSSGGYLFDLRRDMLEPILSN